MPLSSSSAYSYYLQITPASTDTLTAFADAYIYYNSDHDEIISVQAAPQGDDS